MRCPWVDPYLLASPTSSEGFRRWAADLEAPRLGLPVPMLVRLRGLTPQDLMFDRDGLADLLWQRGSTSEVSWTAPETTSTASKPPD